MIQETYTVPVSIQLPKLTHRIEATFPVPNLAAALELKKLLKSLDGCFPSIVKTTVDDDHRV